MKDHGVVDSDGEREVVWGCPLQSFVVRENVLHLVENLEDRDCVWMIERLGVVLNQRDVNVVYNRPALSEAALQGVDGRGLRRGFVLFWGFLAIGSILECLPVDFVLFFIGIEILLFLS